MAIDMSDYECKSLLWLINDARRHDDSAGRIVNPNDRSALAVARGKIVQYKPWLDKP